MSHSYNSIFVGKLPFGCREKDLEEEFGKYGRIKDIDFKKNRGFAFIEFAHSQDAKEAVEEMDGRRFDGSRIVVQYKELRRKRGPDKSDVCYNCGKRGHWANQCAEGDWKNKCYRCGKTGHVKKECPLSRTPSAVRSSRSHAKRNSRSRSRKRRSSSYSSYSRSENKSKSRRRSQSKHSRSNSKSSRSVSKSNHSEKSKSKDKQKSRSRSNSSRSKRKEK